MRRWSRGEPMPYRRDSRRPALMAVFTITSKGNTLIPIAKASNASVQRMATASGVTSPRRRQPTRVLLIRTGTVYQKMYKIKKLLLARKTDTSTAIVEACANSRSVNAFS